MLADDLIVFLSNNLGHPEDQIRFMLALLLPYPMGYLMQLIKSPKFRFLYSLSAGLLVITFLHSELVIYPILETLVAYLLIRIVPRKYIGWTLTTFTMLCICAFHIYRMIYCYGVWSINLSFVTMTMTMSYGGLGFDLQDGMLPMEELSEHAKSNRLTETPSLLNCLGFTFNFGQCIIGPFYTMREYLDWINLRGKYQNIPQTFTSSLWRLLQGFLCLVVTSLLGKYVPASIITQATELEKCPLLLRIPYLAMAMLGVRTRYYVAWMIAEGAARATGMAYKSPEMTSVSVLGIETSINIRNATQYWNHAGHIWLKYYVYGRIIDPKRKRASLAYILTFIISAMWHGFYIIYYFTFFYFGFIGQNYGSLYKIALKYPIFRTIFFIIIYWVFSVLSMTPLVCIFLGINLNTALYIVTQPLVLWIPVVHLLIFLFVSFTNVTKMKQKVQITDYYPQEMRIYHLIPSLRPKIKDSKSADKKQ